MWYAIFPEGNVMHGKRFIGFKHWTLQKLGWHDTQVMTHPKLAMEDSTVHSDKVIVVVGECQRVNNFSLN